jgi:hypothetical protein
VYSLYNCLMNPPQLPYGQVGYREQSSDYIFRSGYFILFSSHSVEVGEYWCNLEYSIVLYGDSSKCRGFLIMRYILHHYHTHTCVTGTKPYVLYW